MIDDVMGHHSWTAFPADITTYSGRLSNDRIDMHRVFFVMLLWLPFHSTESNLGKFNFGHNPTEAAALVDDISAEPFQPPFL